MPGPTGSASGQAGSRRGQPQPPLQTQAGRPCRAAALLQAPHQMPCGSTLWGS